MLAQLAKDGQQDTMHNTSRYMITTCLSDYVTCQHIETTSLPDCMK